MINEYCYNIFFFCVNIYILGRLPKSFKAHLGASVNKYLHYFLKKGYKIDTKTRGKNTQNNKRRLLDRLKDYSLNLRKPFRIFNDCWTNLNIFILSSKFKLLAPNKNSFTFRESDKRFQPSPHTCAAAKSKENLGAEHWGHFNK